MNKSAFLCLCLAAIGFCSAISVAYSKHLSQRAYFELSSIQQSIDALAIQWSRLQIEESTFSEHGRVERTARERLGMELPGLAASVMIVR